MAQSTPFFPTDRVAVLAHRGLALTAPENSLAAFRAALESGADVLECDVRASHDGVAVFAHDETLLRVFGDPRRVDDVDYAELVTLGTGTGTGSGVERGIVSVSDALAMLPTARFNIDVKSEQVIVPLVEAVRSAAATSRVLITSFSARRRRKTRAGLPGVTTSASAEVVVPVVLACALGLPQLVSWISRRTGILQIPTSAMGIDLTTPRIIARMHRAGFIVHFWTVNDATEMVRLARNGADGIVTDRCDTAVQLFRHG